MVETTSSNDKEKKMQQNFTKLAQNNCYYHDDLSSDYFCIHSDCVKNSRSFLCEFCKDSHEHEVGYVRSIQNIFSKNILDTAKKIAQKQEDHFQQDSKLKDTFIQVSKIFSQLETKLITTVKETCQQAQLNVISIIAYKCFEFEKIKRTISNYERMLSDLLAKDDLPEFKIFINEYLEEQRNLSDVIQFHLNHQPQREPSNDDIAYVINRLTGQLQEWFNHFDLSINQLMKQKIELLDEQFTNYKDLSDRLKNIKIEKSIPREHSSGIYRMIYSPDKTKYYTCSGDHSILVRNSNNDQIIKKLYGHTNNVSHLTILSDGKMISSSLDNKLKIWNTVNWQCEQTFIGHTSPVLFSFELSSSNLITGSYDNTLKLWDLNDKSNPLNAKFTLNNYGKAWSFLSIDKNEFAVSSSSNINIWKFDYIYNDTFHITKTLTGHTNCVRDIKLLPHLKEFILSCSSDTKIKLWKLTGKGSCIKTFLGHNSWVFNLLVLTEDFFISAGGRGELLVWDKNKDQKLHSFDQNLIENLDMNSLYRINDDMFTVLGDQKKIHFLKF